MKQIQFTSSHLLCRRLQRRTWCLLSSATRRFHSSSVSSAPPSVVSSASCVLSATVHKHTQPVAFTREPGSRPGEISCSQLHRPTGAGHGSAHPVAACAHAAVALHLGLGSVLVGLVLQGAFCRGGHIGKKLQRKQSSFQTQTQQCVCVSLSPAEAPGFTAFKGYLIVLCFP